MSIDYVSGQIIIAGAHAARFAEWREWVLRAIARRWPDAPEPDEAQLAMRWLAGRSPHEVAVEYVDENKPNEKREGVMATAGDRVKCICSDNVTGLTEGKVYEILGVHESGVPEALAFDVTDDHGHVGWYYADRFSKYPEPRRSPT